MSVSCLPDKEIREGMTEFNNNIQAKLNARYNFLDTSAGLHKTDSIIDVQKGSRTLGEIFTT